MGVRGAITIGDNVRLGSGMIVGPGVTIGANTVVGAGSWSRKNFRRTSSRSVFRRRCTTASRSAIASRCPAADYSKMRCSVANWMARRPALRASPPHRYAAWSRRRSIAASRSPSHHSDLPRHRVPPRRHGAPGGRCERIARGHPVGASDGLPARPRRLVSATVRLTTRPPSRAGPDFLSLARAAEAWRPFGFNDVGARTPPEPHGEGLAG